MLKYYNYDIVFQEYPDEVTLAINLTMCPNLCKGCHSIFLRKDIGEELTLERLISLIDSYNNNITCVGIQGGDNDPEMVLSLCKDIRKHYKDSIHTGWYSGRNWLTTKDVLKESLHYIKIGAYIAEKGPLSSPSTNQRFYKIDTLTGELIDQTKKFTKRKLSK